MDVAAKEWLKKKTPSFPLSQISIILIYGANSDPRSSKHSAWMYYSLGQNNDFNINNKDNNMSNNNNNNNDCWAVFQVQVQAHFSATFFVHYPRTKVDSGWLLYSVACINI